MEYKDIIEYISTKDIEEFSIKNLLESYVLFIVSNPDFKYNQTYFTDGFIDFEKSIRLLHTRAKIFKKIARKLLSKQKSSIFVESSTIAFDSIYKYTLTDKIETQIISDNSSFILHNYYDQPIKFECEVKNKKGEIRNFAYEINKKTKDKELETSIINIFEKIIDSTK